MAHGRSIPEANDVLGADRLVFQEVEDMKAAILAGQSEVTDLEMSCFDGRYIAGRVDDEYLRWVEETTKS